MGDRDVKTDKGQRGPAAGGGSGSGGGGGSGVHAALLHRKVRQRAASRAVLAAPAPAPAAATPQLSVAYATFRAALAADNAHDYMPAMAGYQRVLDTSPSHGSSLHVNALFGLAHTQMVSGFLAGAEGHWVESLRYLRDALANFRRCVDAMNMQDMANGAVLAQAVENIARLEHEVVEHEATVKQLGEGR